MIGFSAGAMLTMATTLNSRRRQTRVHRQHLRPARRPWTSRPTRRRSSPRSPPTIRSLAAELRPDRKLAQGQAPRRVPLLRTRRTRLRHVPQGDHQHRLVRRLRQVARHARIFQAQNLAGFLRGQETVSEGPKGPPSATPSPAPAKARTTQAAARLDRSSTLRRQVPAITTAWLGRLAPCLGRYVTPRTRCHAVPCYERSRSTPSATRQ